MVTNDKTFVIYDKKTQRVYDKKTKNDKTSLQT